MTTRPPGGAPPPVVAHLDGEELDLVALAARICERYAAVYPDEVDRYGPAGAQWCRHDNQWLLSWAVADTLGAVDLNEQALWLSRVLGARAFPVERLVEDLRMAAEVVEEANIDPSSADAVGAALRRAAQAVLVTIEPEA
jgi:hypothetical protein